MLNSNSIWYMGLAIISLVLLCFVFLKTKSVRSLLLFIMMVECAYLFETVIDIFFNSYEYHPNIIKYDDYYDNNIGALTSNLLIVPTLATLIAAFHLNWSWILFFIGLLAGVEWLFVKLQIYTLHWWRIEYTSLGLLVYFRLAKVLYKLLLQPLKGLLHSLLLFFSIAPIAGTLHVIPIMLFANRNYRPGWFENPAHDTTAFASIYYVCVCITIVLLVKLRWKYRYIFVPLMISIVTITLEKVGILNSFVWWDKWFYIFFPIAVMIVAERISAYLSANKNLSK